ncbi:MAG: phosphatase PAP2 family protein [Gemmatimonadota bacterium]|nr:phosphatase PAP2 family protein [Gemmatimonadota bacterium]
MSNSNGTPGTKTKSRSRPPHPEYPLAGIAIAAAGAFAILTWRVDHNRNFFSDYQRQRRIPRLRGPGKRAATLLGYAGKDAGIIPLGLAVAAGLWTKGSRGGAGAVIGAVCAASGLSHLFELVLPHRTPPPGRRDPLNPSFPSGHALRTSALILTASYVLSRESKLDPRVIGGSALLLAGLTGIDRILLDRHWTTDVAAGWLAGLSVSSIAGSGYEVVTRSYPGLNRPRLKIRKSAD